jgi:hypothetical protein
MADGQVQGQVTGGIHHFARRWCLWGGGVRLEQPLDHARARARVAQRGVQRQLALRAARGGRCWVRLEHTVHHLQRQRRHARQVQRQPPKSVGLHGSSRVGR